MMAWPDKDAIDRCAFCGCDALDLVNTADEYYVECRICGLSAPTAEDPYEAARIWNAITMA